MHFVEILEKFEIYGFSVRNSNSQSFLNLNKSKVRSGKYMVFISKFKNGNDTLNLWKKIWSFFESSNLIRAYKIDFERYFDRNLYRD